VKPTLMGSLRNRIFAPDPREATFERRGWQPTDPARQANLEKVGGIFLTGFGYGLTGRGITDMESSLETVDKPFRGFAYEGCAMALAVRDALLPAGRHWVNDFLEGPGKPHVYMAHVGVGWAMARLPSIRWRAIMPDDEVLRWLALDGYGFHQAYFHTSKYVGQQHQARVPLFKPTEYASRVIDQGIGRAMWFVNGSDVRAVADAFGKFAPHRRGDLWSGVGLASVYAGGVEPGDLTLLRKLAGEHAPDGAQGAAFGAKARLLAGLETPHTEAGAQAWCGMSAQDAAAVTEQAVEVLFDTGGQEPGYERWRRRIRQRFE